MYKTLDKKINKFGKYNRKNKCTGEVLILNFYTDNSKGMRTEEFEDRINNLEVRKHK